MPLPYMHRVTDVYVCEINSLDIGNTRYLELMGTDIFSILFFSLQFGRKELPRKEICSARDSVCFSGKYL